jgi:copper chaperone CopZ
MKINKKIKVALGLVLGLAFLLFATLIVHVVVMVKGKPPLAMATIQMARADFQEPVDASGAAAIQNNIKKLPGVKDTYFNVKDHIVTYTYDNKLNSAQNIYDAAIGNSGYKSRRYLVSRSDLAKGCPVMNSNSFYGKLTDIISGIVN